MSELTFIGLDVHARSVAAAVLKAESGEVSSCAAPARSTKLVAWLRAQVRIPLKPNACSAASRTVIPREAEHLGAKRRVCFSKVAVLFAFRSTPSAPCRLFYASTLLSARS
jgi:hypothetical protein